MGRYLVKDTKKEDSYNVFSTNVDDYYFDDFHPLEDIRKEMEKIIKEELEDDFKRRIFALMNSTHRNETREDHDKLIRRNKFPRPLKKD
ncbi:MAG: hypothetical protein ACOCP4_04240 [Candidatus Woesearchaeota archaeon]